MFNSGFQFLPAEIDRFVAGEMIKRGVFNAMDDPHRFADGGDKVQVAPRSHGPGGDVHDPSGQLVAAAKVVQQPAIETKVDERLLNFVELKHGG